MLLPIMELQNQIDELRESSTDVNSLSKKIDAAMTSVNGIFGLIDNIKKNGVSTAALEMVDPSNQLTTKGIVATEGIISGVATAAVVITEAAIAAKNLIEIIMSAMIKIGKAMIELYKLTEKHFVKVRQLFKTFTDTNNSLIAELKRIRSFDQEGLKVRAVSYPIFVERGKEVVSLLTDIHKNTVSKKGAGAIDDIIAFANSFAKDQKTEFKQTNRINDFIKDLGRISKPVNELLGYDITLKEVKDAKFPAKIKIKRLKKGKKNTAYLDDTYCTSPEAAINALKSSNELLLIGNDLKNILIRIKSIQAVIDNNTKFVKDWDRFEWYQLADSIEAARYVLNTCIKLTDLMISCITSYNRSIIVITNAAMVSGRGITDK